MKPRKKKHKTILRAYRMRKPLLAELERRSKSTGKSSTEIIHEALFEKFLGY